MSKYPLTRITIVLALTTLFLFVFSHLGAFAFETFVSNEDVYAEGTTVASVNVANKTPEEAKILLAEEITNWKSQQKLELVILKDMLELKEEFYSIDLDTTVSSIQSGQDNSLVTEINQEAFQNALTTASFSIDINAIDYELLETDLIQAIGMLQQELVLNIEQYFTTETSVGTISEASIKLGEIPAGLSNFIGQFPTIEINETSQFSLLEFLKEHEAALTAKEDLSILASALYQVVLPTNFQIVERNQSIELPSYASLGYEAKVSIDDNQDFVFTNPNTDSYSIKLDLVNDRLYVSLIGPQFIYDYSIALKDQEKFPPRTIKYFSAYVNKGDVQIVEEGKDGLLVSIYREVFDQTGFKIEELKISEDFYPPIHRKELHSIEASLPDRSGTNNGEESVGFPSNEQSEDGQLEESDNPSQSPSNEGTTNSNESSNESTENTDQDSATDSGSNTDSASSGSKVTTKKMK